MVSSLQLIHAILNLIDPSIRQRRSEKQIFDSLQETSVDHRAWPENFNASAIENKKYFAIDDSFPCVLGVRAHIKKKGYKHLDALLDSHGKTHCFLDYIMLCIEIVVVNSHSGNNYKTQLFARVNFCLSFYYIRRTVGM